jgi:ribulose-phosphate 3-epimerase
MLLKNYTALMTIEVDLMIHEPERALPVYVEAGVQKVVVHLESTTHFADIVDHHRSHAYALGLSISNDTSLDSLMSAIPYADYVQLMGIRKIGSQGQQFDTTVLERVRVIQKEYPTLTISIDGSVNEDTLPLLREAGGNRFVSGSAILGAVDPLRAYEVLVAL